VFLGKLVIIQIHKISEGNVTGIKEMNLNPFLFVFGKLEQKEVIINAHDQEK
jgi:hypothetical protein